MKQFFLISIFLVFCMASKCSEDNTTANCEQDTSNDNDTDSDSTQVSGDKKRCEGLRFAYFAGGAEDGIFARTLSNGANAAASDLGIDLEIIYSDWISNDMPPQLETILNTNPPDGIAVLGHPVRYGDPEPAAKWKELIDQAFDAGILVTSQNVLMPTVEEKYQAVGFGYVGQNEYDAGRALAAEAARRTNLEKGDRVWIWGGPKFDVLTESEGRARGLYEEFEDLGMVVDYQYITDPVSADPSNGTEVVTAYIKDNPDVKIMAVDSGPLTESMETFLNSAGKKADDIFVVGFDLSPNTAEAIVAGWVDLVQDQQPYLQGYLPILQMCLTKRYAFSGLYIGTGAGFIDENNIDQVSPLVEQFIR
jgi:simple sugar transport system substrate-binding protein